MSRWEPHITVSEMLHLSVGSEFSPLIAFHKAVKLYEHEKKVTFWTRDSRTFENAWKRGINVIDNKDLKYYSMTLSCTFGGRSFKSSRKENKVDPK